MRVCNWMLDVVALKAYFLIERRQIVALLGSWWFNCSLKD